MGFDRARTPTSAHHGQHIFTLCTANHLFSLLPRDHILRILCLSYTVASLSRINTSYIHCVKFCILSCVMNDGNRKKEQLRLIHNMTLILSKVTTIQPYQRGKTTSREGLMCLLINFTPVPSSSPDRHLRSNLSYLVMIVGREPQREFISPHIKVFY